MTTALGNICLLEDDPILGEALSSFFQLEDLDCDWFRTVSAARDALQHRNYGALVSDIRLPDGDGGRLYLELARSGRPCPPTLFVTAHASVAQAVELVKFGARDYITKPFDLDDLMIKLQRMCPALFDKANPGRREVLGVSPAMRGIEKMLERVARHPVPVLITGESGVGKEHAARYLHQCRGLPDAAPLLGINCAAVPSDLIESELFGAEKGAFTGAVSTRKGLFEQAGSGSLFLDEAGEMPLDMQAKLLRAVQERKIRRVGGSEDIPIGAQLIWATNCDLSKRVAEGRFREDLYFRISTVRVELPPLRDRTEDIAWFAHRFLDDIARDTGKRCYLTPSAEDYLRRCSWPGNVRELRQAIERAVIFSDSCVLEPGQFTGAGRIDAVPSQPEALKNLRDYLADCELWYIQRALEETSWRIGETAERLGISRKSLWERMNRLGVERPDPMEESRGH